MAAELQGRASPALKTASEAARQERASRISALRRSITETETKSKRLIRNLELADGIDQDFIRDINERRAELRARQDELLSDAQRQGPVQGRSPSWVGDQGVAYRAEAQVKAIQAVAAAIDRLAAAVEALSPPSPPRFRPGGPQRPPG